MLPRRLPELARPGDYYDITLHGFTEGLREEGFVQGKNLELVRRSASNDAGRFKPMARELAASKVDVFFAPATPMATAAWYADRNTPIVIATIMDPVELDFVKSLARPGTRVTGVTTMNDELTDQAPAVVDGGRAGPEPRGCGHRRGDAQRLHAGDRPCARSGQGTRPDAGDGARRPARGARRGFRKLADAKVQAVTARCCRRATTSRRSTPKRR